MKDQVGSLCAILAGVFTALAGITYYLLPPEQQLGVPGAVLLPSVAQNATWLTLENLELALLGIFGIGLVPALGRRLRRDENGWLRWMGDLAMVGYAVSAVGNLLVLGRLPGIASAYQAATNEATRAALAAVWRTSLDPLGLWGYGAIGLWILVASVAALRLVDFPKALAYFGMGIGVLHWLVPIGFGLRVPGLFLLVAILAIIAASVWYVWIGVVLRRAAPADARAPEPGMMARGA